MHETHVYEVIGDVLFRRSGGRSKTLRCKVVRTRGFIEHVEDGVIARLSVITSGFEGIHFKKWFSDWNEADNMDPSPEPPDHRLDFQTGRPIDIAIPLDAYDWMIETGGTPPTVGMWPPEEGSRPSERPFHPSVAAVLIDGRWEEPE